MIMDKYPAVILAAGKGQRLGSATDKIPKPMVEVNGIQIIDNLISALIENNIDQIVVVTGYLHETLSDHLDQFSDQVDLVIIENEVFDTTNNIYSLWKARDYLKKGFYLFEADIFFDKQVIKNLLNSTHQNVMLVGKYTSAMEGTVVSLISDSIVENMYLKRHQELNFNFSDKFKTVNFYKIGEKFTEEYFLEKLEEHIIREDLNSYYELIIEEALKAEWQFFGLDAGTIKWWEIDTQADLNYCESLFKRSD
jgi:choline kinase